jgi:hypothetical protein
MKTRRFPFDSEGGAKTRLRWQARCTADTGARAGDRRDRLRQQRFAYLPRLSTCLRHSSLSLSFWPARQSRMCPPPRSTPAQSFWTSSRQAPLGRLLSWASAGDEARMSAVAIKATRLIISNSPTDIAGRPEWPGIKFPASLEAVGTRETERHNI